MARSRPRLCGFRLDFAEYAALQAASQRIGTSLSGLVRARLADVLTSPEAPAPSFIPEPGRAAA